MIQVNSVGSTNVMTTEDGIRELVWARGRQPDTRWTAYPVLDHPLGHDRNDATELSDPCLTTGLASTGDCKICFGNQDSRLMTKVASGCTIVLASVAM